MAIVTFPVLNSIGHRYTKSVQVIGADQGVSHISHKYRYTLQYLQDLEKPIQVISELSCITRNPPFGVFFTIFHHFYQNSKLLKLIQNTLDVLLIIIHNLSFYAKMISVI